ncbi:FliM/FliN family flagellar motor switch protein [Alienimonas sp. DA493]|uniref:FliM/FliN family flagellar motor switch protein n=1 Tax=Alienimonas sp. DA493 TaxID=3373605 RepID=UPI0037545916
MSAPLPARLARLPVPVTVRLAEKRVPLSTIRNLVPGALLSFDKDCSAPLDLYVANRKHAVGEAVKVGERFGLKVTAVRGR